MVSLKNVVKIYRTRKGDVKALDGINLRIEKGEFVVVRGPSGSGKTTLLMTIAGMLHPTSGTIFIGQRDLYAMSIRARAKFRAENIGFVFQMFHLVPYLNVAENIVLAGGVARPRRAGRPAQRAGQDQSRLRRPAPDQSRLRRDKDSPPRQTLRRESQGQARELIEKLGLAGRSHHKPSELSAGERQRTAIARALLNRPKIILADEPTGNLDPDNAAVVLGYIDEFHRQGGTVILATHGPAAKDFADRTIYLRNGSIDNSGS
jgi:ABC-type lipoprotein export system ATPase subunit